MTQNIQEDNAKITPPDYTLLNKVGAKRLDDVFSNKAISSAEETIRHSKEDFLFESLAQAKQLITVNQHLRDDVDGKRRYFSIMIENAFAIKSKSGQAGYELVSAVAKSLQLFCEQRQDIQMTKKDLDIIQWHVSTITLLLDRHMQGDGGSLGKEIIAQIQKLTTSPILMSSDEAMLAI